MKQGMNIRDKLWCIEAQYKIPLHNQRYEKGYLKEKLKIQSSSSKHLPFVINPRSFLRQKNIYSMMENSTIIRQTTTKLFIQPIR
jgi:hypothetical protein